MEPTAHLRLSDPWSALTPDDRPVPRWPGVLGAAAIACIGPVLRFVVISTPTAQQVAIVLLSAGVALAVATVATGRTTSAQILERGHSAVRRTLAAGAAAVVLSSVGLVVGRPGDLGMAAGAALLAATALRLAPEERLSSSDAHGTAIPPFITAAAGWCWAQQPPGWPAPVLLLSAAAVLLLVQSNHAARRADDAVERGVRWVGTVLLPNLVTLMVASLVLYLPAAVLGLLRWVAHGSSPRSPSWEEVAVDRAQRLKDGGYPFASTAPAVRRRRLVVSTLIALAGAALVVAAWQGR